MHSCPTLEQIIGHATVLANLQRAMDNHHPGHAHLFFGPPGIGKATVAAAFVQALFCPQRERHGGSGCGQCPPCRKVASGNHGDLVSVTVLEGKTRIGVDQVRQLAGFFSLTPMEAPWKVAIVDDAAEMNEAAANALLKTLEEPPARSLLILITHQAGRLLPTIRSRCLKTRFTPLTQSEMQQILRQHAAGKTFAQLDDQALQQIIAIGGHQLGRILTFSQGEWPQWQEKFQQEMSTLPTATLAQILRMAEQWSVAEKFVWMPVLLRTWMQSRLHRHCHTTPTRDNMASWLKMTQTIDSLLHQASSLNLNRRLVLESILIRLARLQGAAC
ncbi:MAG: DNA polymerase III subunit delta' [Magnetococcales bacterium]|nr:DNA polymerase III subunit delta' [Magnetococcales bacterium]